MYESKLDVKENDNKPNPLNVTVIEHGKPYIPLHDIEMDKIASSKKSIPAELLSVKEHKAIEDYNASIGDATETMKETVKKMQMLHAAKSEDIAEKYKNLISEMEQIQREISNIQSQPLIKDDVIRLSIQNLLSNRDKIKKEMLKDHFELVGSSPTLVPFSEDVVERILVSRDTWKLLYFIISEEDISSCAQDISNEGLSMDEREKAVKSLNKKFTVLHNEVMNEAKKLGLS